MAQRASDSVENSVSLRHSGATTVRKLFELYLDCHSIRELQRRSEVLGLHTCGKLGAARADRRRSFFCGHLRAILTNPIYVGRIRHGRELYDGQHQAIIDLATFEKAQALLASRANRSITLESRDGVHLLTGLVFSRDGDQLGPTHATKAGRRYRYYVSRRLLTKSASDRGEGWRIPASQLDDLVCEYLHKFLNSRVDLIEMSRDWLLDTANLNRLFAGAAALADELKATSPAARQAVLRRLVQRVIVDRDAISIAILCGALAVQNGCDVDQIDATDAVTTHTISVPFALKRRGVETRLVIADAARIPDPGLIRLIARSHIYMCALTDGSGTTIAELARREQLDVSDLSRMLKLTYLAPAIVEAILRGKHPPELTPHQLMRASELPLDWQHQVHQLGF
jgi:hypothetical protein